MSRSACSIRLLHCLRFSLLSLGMLIFGNFTGRANDPATFGSPLQITNGGSTVVKAVGTYVLPVNDGDGNDNGADFLAPLNLNGDGGAWDIVTADHDSKLIRIRQQSVGGGSYTNFDLTAANSPTDLVVADVNGDGQLDLITCEAGSIVVYLNTRDVATPGSLSFAAPVSYSANDMNGAPLTINKIAVADVDHDHLQDLIGVGTALDINSAANIQLVVFRNTFPQAQPFAAPVLYTAFGTGDFVVAANLTRNTVPPGGGTALDWFPEIIVGCNNGDNASNGSGSGSLVTFMNRGNGTFGDSLDATFHPRPFYSGLHLHALAVGDLDGDGNRDVVIEGSNIGDGKQTFIDVFGGDGAGNFSSWIATAFIGGNANKVLFQGDLALADFDGDGNPDLAVTDPINTHGVIVWTIDPAAADHAFFPPLPFPNRTKIVTAPGARAITITDHNVDNKFDLVVANDDANNLSILDNTTVGIVVVDPPPAGRVIQFGTITSDVSEGDLIHIPVLRGKDSTGQVLVFFQFGGTALQSFGGVNKNADFDQVDPPAGVPLVFAEGEHTKTLTLRTLTNAAAERAETLEITILEPVGDAEIGDPAVATINILDGKPAILKKPGALSIKPENIVPTTAAQLKLLGVKAVARTHSYWNFSVAQTFPKDAANAKVKVQYSFVPPPSEQWNDLLDLEAKGTTWSGHTATIPVCSKLYFRTFGTADGYPAAPGATSLPYKVVAGPDIGLYASQAQTVADQFVTFPLPVYAGGKLTYRFDFNAVSSTGAAPATNVVVKALVPKHTSFASASGDVVIPNTFESKGRITSVEWRLGTVTPGASGSFFLVVNVDPVTGFSKDGNPLKVYGTEIIGTGFGVSASEGIKNQVAGPDSLTAVLHGPIELFVSRSPATVKGGDLITYDLRAENTSTTAVTGAIVRDRIPLGTILDSVFAPDANGNSSSTVLPNPGPGTNPAVVYVLLANAKFLHKKKGDEIDLSVLDTNTINKLLDAHLIAQEIKWPIGSMAAHSQVTLQFKVRALYDLADPNAGSATPPVEIVNDDFDFTVSSGTTDGSGNPILISALYGDPPPVVSSGVSSAAPTTKPVIGLGKIAVGDHDLNNSIVHGNGSQQIAGLGEVTTAVQNHGFDYELFYINSGEEAAHHVVLHDVIPAGAELLGNFTQSINGAAAGGMNLGQFTFYDAVGNVLPSVTNENIRQVRSMDIRLSQVDVLTPLPAGDFGVIRYSIQPTLAPAATGKPAALIHALGGFDPKLRRSDPLQGAYITCADLQRVVPATPGDTIVKIVSDVSWDLHYTKGAFQAKPGDIVPFDFTYTQNGDIDAAACHIDFTVPSGTTLLISGPNAPVFTDATGGAVSTTLTGSAASLNLGTIAAQASRKLRLNLQVNTPLDAALAAKKAIAFDPDPVIKGSPILPTAAVAERGLLSTRDTIAGAVASSTATDKQPVPVHELGAPKLSLARSAPYTVKKGGVYTYTIAFNNSGDTDALNVQVGMQIPYFTSFVATTNGVVNAFTGATITPTPNLNAYTTTPRTAAQVKVTGLGPDIITWHFTSLPAHSTGSIMLKVQIYSTFADDCVKDHSLYVSADNAASVVLAPNPLGTWVIGKPFDTSKWEVLGCFCEHLNIPINATTRPALTAFVNQLTGTSQVRATAGIDGFHLNNGVSVFALGNGQVMVLGAEIVAQGGGNITITGAGANIVAQGGGNIVATGGGNAISVTNVASLGTKAADYILANAPSIVAQGGGNIIAAGGGNLIGAGGSTLLSNLAGGLAVPISAIAANIVASGAGNIIAAGAGNIVASGAGNLIGQDGGGLISQDGGGLISQDGGGLISVSSGNVISNDGGSIVASGAGNLSGTGK